MTKQKRNDKRTAKGPVKVSRPQLAAITGKHVDTVTDWSAAGMPVLTPGGHGRPAVYDAVACLKWVRERFRELAPAEAARARRETAQALETEQRIAMRAGDLLQREDVERLWTAEITAVRTKLLALPSMLADRLHRVGRLEGPNGIEAALEEEMRNVLIELADPKREPTQVPPK